MSWFRLCQEAGSAWWQRRRRAERIVLGLLLAAGLLWPFSPLALLPFLASLPGILVLLYGLLRHLIRLCLWRLRHRLLAAYLFIAVTPVLLIATMALLSAYAGANQLVVYLVTSELERRTNTMTQIATATEGLRRQGDVSALRRIGEFYRAQFPGLSLRLDMPDATEQFGSPFETPPADWQDAHGLLVKEGRLFGWGHLRRNEWRVTVLTPMDDEYLSNLLPGVGIASFSGSAEPLAAGPTQTDTKEDFVIFGKRYHLQRSTASNRTSQLPPPVNRFDNTITWISVLPAASWLQPNQQVSALLMGGARPSALFQALFLQKANIVQGILPTVLSIIAAVFLLVELGALLIGLRLSHSITSAVHRLYEGTQRVQTGDFTHRIAASGNDQLGELGTSFNTMTETVERLLAVEKETQRLQAELEIAREVQSQLFPKSVPQLASLRLQAACKPARMVSGDCYDYQKLDDARVALSLGDVAGKGISAALLMASLQSSLRTDLHSSLERAAAVDQGSPAVRVSTSHTVSRMNVQLYAHSAPEKYATFYFAVFDETTNVLTYTNAGHLPPLVFRGDEVMPLEVSGTVVGLFASTQYENSRITLQSGDLLVCYTDGVTEPENEYGEMFGEERLIDTIRKNLHRTEGQIIESVMQCVEEWTGSPELQDDMTLLLARRV